VVIFTSYCSLFVGDTDEYLFCPVLPVMVSGLGMSPGKHLQMGFPSLKAEKCADWWLILYQIVVEKSHPRIGFLYRKVGQKGHPRCGFFIFFNTGQPNFKNVSNILFKNILLLM
jgi:hypothetical protein